MFCLKRKFDVLVLSASLFKVKSVLQDKCLIILDGGSGEAGEVPCAALKVFVCVQRRISRPASGCSSRREAARVLARGKSGGSVSRRGAVVYLKRLPSA